MVRSTGKFIKRFGHPMRRFTPEDDAQLKTMWFAYVPQEQIAEVLGRTPGTIQQRTHRLGLHRNHNLSRALHNYAPQHLWDKIGHVSEKELLRHCHEWRDAERKHERERVQRAAREYAERVAGEIAVIVDDENLTRRDKMLRMRALGLTLSKIGQAFDVTHERARQIINNKPRYAHPGRPPKYMERLLQLWEVTPTEVREAFLRRVQNEDGQKGMASA